MSLPTNRINVKVFHSIVGSGWFFQENVNIKKEGDATFPSSFKIPVQYSKFKTASVPRVQS
jgi:hypothetical protein